MLTAQQIYTKLMRILAEDMIFQAKHLPKQNYAMERSLELHVTGFILTDD